VREGGVMYSHQYDQHRAAKLQDGTEEMIRMREPQRRAVPIKYAFVALSVEPRCMEAFNSRAAADAFVARNPNQAWEAAQLPLRDE
jgi:hypothetical protein